MPRRMRIVSRSEGQYPSYWLTARAPVRLGQDDQGSLKGLLVGAAALVVALSVWYGGRRRLLQQQAG